MSESDRRGPAAGGGAIGLTVRFESGVLQPLLVIEGAAIEHVCEAGRDHHFVSLSAEDRPYLELDLGDGRVDVWPSTIDGWSYWCGESELHPEPRRGPSGLPSSSTIKTTAANEARALVLLAEQLDEENA